MATKELVRELVEDGVLKSKHIIEAFSRIDRADFVPGDLRDYAYANEPLSIGYGQTISQPWTVAFMLELLAPSSGDRVLDVGAGSGWTTALLSFIVSHDKFGGELEREEWGEIIAIEIVPELARFARVNISKYNFVKKGIAEVHCLSAEEGFLKAAPYTKIISAASASRVPSAWKAQLVMGGVMVLPLGNKIVKITKESEDLLREESHEGFAFVPFIEKDEKDSETA